MPFGHSPRQGKNDVKAYHFHHISASIKQVINIPYLSGSEVSRGHVTKIHAIRSYAKIRTNLGLSPPVVHIGILADTCTKSGVPTPKFQIHLKGHFSPFLAFFN